MFLQLAIGTGLIIFNVMGAGLMAWALEKLLAHGHAWLTEPPHRPKLAVVLSATVLWALAVMTAGVWAWAILFRVLGLFAHLEEALYFAMVSFTTLGFGDVLLVQEWRLLAGLCAANGFITFGLLTAMMVEILRHVRLSQLAGDED